jgi:integrase
VRLLLLTAQRREEVAAIRWSELSADLSTWTLPAARAKNARAHLIYLAEPARAILASVPRIVGQDLIFSVTGTTPPSGFSKAKLALDAAMARELPTGRAGWRFHDFRRTAVTWLAGAGFAPHVADRLLNHVGGTINGVAAIYQRGEFLAERQAALTAWAAHVVLQCGAGATAADNVAVLSAERAQRRA